MILIIMFFGCMDPHATTTFKPGEVVWTEINSPKAGYECYIHRGARSTMGFESAVCFKLINSPHINNQPRVRN